MKYLNPRPLVLALLLLAMSVWAGRAGAGEQPQTPAEERVKAAAVGLRSKDEVQRLQAAVELLRLGKQAEPAVPELIASLRAGQGGLLAALALGRVGKPAVKPLVALLQKAPGVDRTLPLCSLSWIGPSAGEAAPAVRKLLKSKDPNLVAWAAYALARISPANRPAAIAALKQIIDQRPGRSEFAPLLLVWLRPEAPGPLVPALVRELRTESCMFGEIDRVTGAYGLAELGPAAGPAVPALREALADREPLVRALAAYALAKASSADRPAAVRTLRAVAGQKPGPDTREFQFGSESTRTFKRAEVDAVAAVVDVLLTQEPGDHFPTSFILTWVKQGLRQHDGKLGEWLKASPLSTTLAAEMVRRLGPEAARKPVPRELARWAGTWEGQWAAEGWTLVIDSDTITGLHQGRFRHQGVLRLDSSVTPNLYDQTITEGPDKGKTIRGIYKIDGDRLTLCYVYSSKEKPASRPTKFAVPAGSARLLQTWKRSTQEPQGNLLDRLMSKEEQEKIGVSRLSATQKAALAQWHGRLMLQALADAAAHYRALPNNSYHYKLLAAPKLLSEELAIEKARQTLAREGYKPEQWRLTRADMPPTRAPDGKADKYFDRFTFRPTEGRVHFTDGRQTRTVQVRLVDDWVVCFLFVGL
jgi:uncharacterized protein (TIGR03067 family)